MSDYDPGDWYDDYARRREQRRRKRRYSEYDDQWAAASEDDIYDGDVHIEDLAGGYVWDEEARRRSQSDDDLDAPLDPSLSDVYGPTPIHPDAQNLGPLPPSADRLRDRNRVPRPEYVRSRYDRSMAYPNSPSFQRSRQNPVERVWTHLGFSEPYRPPDIRKAKPGDYDASSGPFSHLPFWGVMVLVTLGFGALIATLLACLSLLVLLG
jgi:hypothetical protein